MHTNPLEIIKLKNLKLAAKIISRQLKNGVHFGKRIGAGSEFEQYRHYEPGDDTKRIDWKLFARSDKYMVKESPVESNLHIRFILDLSGSMNYEEKGIRRLDFAKNLLASLAYLAHQQGDPMTFFTLQNGSVLQKVSPSPKSFPKILYHLETDTASGSWPILKQDFPVLKNNQRELIIMVSDFLQKENEWVDIVEAMRHPKKEIVLFQVLGEQEIAFDLKGNYKFKDLETNQIIEMDGKTVQKTYNEAIQKYLTELDQAFHLPQVHLIRTTFHESIAEVISKYLQKNQLH